jgi:two-component system response regulator MtrA
VSETPNGRRILIIDDDASLAEMLQLVLRQEGFETTWCASGDTALEVFRSAQFDLVLLDLMLPGLDGVAVCRRIRADSGVPIVMLTAKSDTGDVVDGLEAGADDYIPKPFKPRELVARVWTRLRRPPAESETDMIRVGDVTIDVSAHEVKRGTDPIALTPLEFDLLLALARRPHQVFTREKLLEQVWGYRHAADTRLVNVHIQQDPERPELVLTVRGIGYKAGGVAGIK